MSITYDEIDNSIEQLDVSPFRMALALFAPSQNAATRSTKESVKPNSSKGMDLKGGGGGDKSSKKENKKDLTELSK